MSTDAPRISVTIPVYNEEGTLPELLTRLRGVLAQRPGGPHEMIFVDDGSSDSSAEILTREAEADPCVTLVSLSRNFGHQAAVTAGLDYVRGDVVIVMDGDLQDAPEAIPKFLEQHAAGHDVVYAVRVRRKEGLWLRACYALFYRLMQLLSDVSMPTQSGDFGLMSARVVTRLRSMPERHRYVRGLRTWVGFRQIGIEVERDARFAGQPKYGFAKLVRLAFDGLFSFSVKPIRAATLAGALIILGSLLYTMYQVFVKLVLHQSPQGFTSLIIFINFMAGVQLTFLGIIGEYVGRIYEEVKQRPHYIVTSVVRRD